MFGHLGSLTRPPPSLQLLVQLQDKEQIISTLRTENNNLTSALNAAETRVSELYADQSRMEEDLAARIEVVDKLRNQVRELEKEKRDTQRRYNEQVRNLVFAFFHNTQSLSDVHVRSRASSVLRQRATSQVSNTVIVPGSQTEQCSAPIPFGSFCC